MPVLTWPTVSIRVSLRLLGIMLAGPLLLGAVLHQVPGVAALVRHLLPLALEPQRPAASEGLELVGANLPDVLLPILAAVVVSMASTRPARIVNPRVLLDAYLALTLAINLAALALAFTGYGVSRMAPWLPHLPFEFAALAIALSSYLTARRGALRLSDIPAFVGLAAGLIAIAAVIETWGTPHV
jgi:hypothetical protein